MIWIVLAVAAVDYVAVVVSICCLLTYVDEFHPDGRRITAYDVAITSTWPVMLPLMVAQLAREWLTSRWAARKEARRGPEQQH